MAHLQLTSEQARRVDIIQKRSFHRLCKERGVAPEEYETLLLEVLKDDVRRIAAAMGYNSHDQLPADMKATLLATDYWAGKADTNRRHASQLAQTIAKHQDVLPINWDYLYGLARELELSTADRRTLVAEIVSALPHIPIFDAEFNAFVKRESLIDNIPCVCVYECLPSASRGLIDVFCHGMFEFDAKRNGIALKTSKELKRIGSERQFMDACKTCMDMVFGRTVVAVLDPEVCASSNSDLFLPVRIMKASAHVFAWFHEYGHLLMGHLDRAPCHELEFEADLFAWRVVQGEASGDAFKGPYTRFGAVALLSILQLIEIVQARSESKSHPAAGKRIVSLLQSADEQEVLQIAQILASILELFQATARTHYNIEYTCGQS